MKSLLAVIRAKTSVQFGIVSECFFCFSFALDLLLCFNRGILCAKIAPATKFRLLNIQLSHNVFVITAYYNRFTSKVLFDEFIKLETAVLYADYR